jgi:hypothetical protein
MERAELSAPTTVAATLLAGVLAKLGYGWLGIGVMIGLCLLGTARKPRPANLLSRHVSQPVLG